MNPLKLVLRAAVAREYAAGTWPNRVVWRPMEGEGRLKAWDQTPRARLAFGGLLVIGVLAYGWGTIVSKAFEQFQWWDIPLLVAAAIPVSFAALRWGFFPVVASHIATEEN